MSSVEKPKRQKAKEPTTQEPNNKTKETTVKKTKKTKEPKEVVTQEQKETTTTTTKKTKEPKINDFNDLIKQQTQVLAKLQEYMERLEANEQKMESMLNEKK